MRVAGAVLSGGASRRMGRTKALIEVDGVPMARRVADALSEGGCVTPTLIGGEADTLAILGLPSVADLHPGDGPVGGVLTALRHFESADVDAVLVAACDLPFLTADVTSALVQSAVTHPAAGVVVARTDRLEPACALWRTSLLRTVEQSFESGTRALHHVLDGLDVIEVPVRAAELRNVNTPSDLQVGE